MIIIIIILILSLSLSLSLSLLPNYLSLPAGPPNYAQNLSKFWRAHM